MGTQHLANKRFAYEALYDLARATPETLMRRLEHAYHPDAEWRGSHPLNEMRGLDAIAATVWRPLHAAFPDLERRDSILIGGNYEGQDFVGAMGHYCGTFERDWIGIPRTGRAIWIRYGEFHRMRAGRIDQSTVLIDVLDVIRQAGFWPVAPSLGTEGMWPGPITGDGIVLRETDPAEGAANLAQMRDMQAKLGLADYEGKGRATYFESHQVEHWHPNMMWYGPSGIGSTRGVAGFVDWHRIPWRESFRNIKGGQHYVRIGDGAYSATGGWPSITTEHTGGDFMGIPPTGKALTCRVMDFYAHHEGLIRENWIPIDILHMLHQMGVDVFARMRSLFRRGG
jgi:predicted ester cyclase